MRQYLPTILSVNAGYVDTAGFLALQGLFSAHVTGNFVTLGAALVQGSSGIIAKLLALPVFCLVVMLVRLAAGPLAGGPRQLSVILGVQLILLTAAGVMAAVFGPFPNVDSADAVVTGMLLVCAMAVQNAVQRTHLSSFPPTTLMTGNTTQIMIDLADVLRGHPAPGLSARLRRNALSVAGFGSGCAAGAALFSTIDMLCFALPPGIALLSIFMTADDTPKAPPES
nr:YoaK family protein [uncultured Rhodopila sp.]